MPRRPDVQPIVIRWEPARLIRLGTEPHKPSIVYVLAPGAKVSMPLARIALFDGIAVRTLIWKL